MDDESAPWQTAQSAYGPAVARWFDTRWKGKMPDALQRRISEWRDGAMADFWVVDKWLAQCGFHVSELPEETWREEIATGLGHGQSIEDIPERHCQVCGKSISKRQAGSGKSKGAAQYRRAKYCSRECQTEAKRDEKQGRACAQCGKEIPRRRTDTGRALAWTEYATRVYCSTACQKLGQLGNGAKFNQHFVTHNGSASQTRT